MKKVLLGILFSILFIQNVFAGYVIQTPDGRLLGDYPITTPFENVARYIEIDRNQHNLQNYIYRVYPDTYGAQNDYFYTVGTLQYEGPLIDAYKGQVYTLERGDEYINSLTNEPMIYTGPNIIYAPTYKNITDNVRNQWWVGNTGIAYPYNLQRIVEDKKVIKEPTNAKIIYSPSVQHLQ